MLSSIGLIICSISVINCLIYGLHVEEVEKNEKLCLNPPPLCTCFKTSEEYYHASYVYSCSHDESGEKIVLEMHFDNNDWIMFYNISFKIIPDLTNYIKSSGIYFQRIWLPENVSLYDLTSKISTNVKYLEISYLGPDENATSVKHNKHLFDGLSQLESLEINRIDNDVTFNVDIFENLVHLKKLILSYYSRLPKVSFATLHQLQVLRIKYRDVEIEVDAFKNLINLVELELGCVHKFLVFPQIVKSLTNLEKLKLSGPFMIVWPESMFKHNQKLKSITFEFMEEIEESSEDLSEEIFNLKGDTRNFSSINDLLEDVFKTLSNLEELILTRNKLKTLPKDVFVDLVRLELLDLRYNNLIELHDELFDTTLNMKTLMLTSNKLTNISRNVFAKLRKLEILSLANNKLKTIDDSFKSLENLREINLSSNQLSHNQTNNLFDGLEKMEKLYLNNNQLEDFLISNYTEFEDLQIIDLSHNNISKFMFSDWITNQFDFKLYLNHNRIKHFQLDDLLLLETNIEYDINILLFVDNNPVNCDCNAIDLVRFVKKQIEPRRIYGVIDFIANNFTCQEPKQLYNRFVSSLNTSELLCNIETDCPEGCRCDQRSVDNTLIINCSFTKFQQFSTFPDYTNLNLTKTELHVANNKIHSTQLTDIPDNLILFDLRNNSLEFLDDSVIKRFESIDKLFLSRNPWKCNCNAVKFIKFYQIFRSQIVDADDIICSDGRAFRELNTNNLCVQWIEILVVFLLVLSLFAILTAFCVVNKKKIKMWLYAHKCCLGWVSEQEVDKDKIYDAFFIFSHFDDNFVTDLILDLELKSFKCCVHHRDWPVGEMIVTSSLTSIKTSRRIIVVLSPMFIQSNWATWEFRVALIHAFNEKRSRVLIIIYGDPSVIDDLDDDLKTYVRFNSYLDSEDKWFEEKLLFAMPHKADQQKVEKDKKKNKNKKRILTSSEVLNNEIQGIDLEMRHLSDSE
ncbi:unnamed protein product [Diamesa hyperborea]